MTVSEVQLGRQKGLADLEREPEASGEFLPRVKVEVLIDDARCRSVAELIRETAATGRVGDGRVVIVEVDEAVRIRTGERGTLAL
jgi:nitrogen regulatory protein PII